VLFFRLVQRPLTAKAVVKPCLQPRCRIPDCAGYKQDIAGFCTRAPDGAAGRHLTNGSDRNLQPVSGPDCIASEQSDIIGHLIVGKTGTKAFQPVRGPVRGQCKTEQVSTRRGPFGSNIRQIYAQCLGSDGLRRVFSKKVHAGGKNVLCQNEIITASGRKHRSVVG